MTVRVYSKRIELVHKRALHCDCTNFAVRATEAQQTADDLAEAVPELESTVQGMPYAMENIAYSIMYQEDFLQLVEQMMDGTCACVTSSVGCLQWQCAVSGAAAK